MHKHVHNLPRLCSDAQGIGRAGGCHFFRQLRCAGREAVGNLPISAHWLRHTFAMTSLSSGQDLRSVATSLGRASVDTTMDYTEQDAIDLIESCERETQGRVARAGQADRSK